MIATALTALILVQFADVSLPQNLTTLTADQARYAMTPYIRCSGATAAYSRVMTKMRMPSQGRAYAYSADLMAALAAYVLSRAENDRVPVEITMTQVRAQHEDEAGIWDRRVAALTTLKQANALVKTLETEVFRCTTDYSELTERLHLEAQGVLPNLMP